MSAPVIFSLFGLVALLAGISLAVSLYVASRVTSLLPRLHGSAELSTTVNAVRLQQAEIMDRVEHWTRRDRVRRLREGQEQAAAAVDDDEVITGADLKDALRRQAGMFDA